MRRHKVAVFGNSVSEVPLKEDKTVVPYPELLQKKLLPLGWEVISGTIGGGTILQIEEVARQVFKTEIPRIVIIQAGIVDCLPRPLSPKERAWLSNLRPSLLRAAVIRLIHHFRAEIIGVRGVIQFTPLSEYLNCLKRLLEICYQYDCLVGILPVFPVTQSITSRNPLLSQEIEKYNQGMRMSDARPYNFDIADFFGHRLIESVMISPESVHFNQQGHDLIAGRLFAWMSPTLENVRC